MENNGALAASIERFNASQDVIVVEVGRGPDDWLTVGDIGQPHGIEILRSAAMQVTGPADDRTVGCIVVTSIATVASVAAHLFVRERRVPRLDARAVRFLPWSPAGPARVALGTTAFSCLPDDDAAGEPEATVVPDIPGLRAQLVRMAEEFLSEAAVLLRETTHLGDRAIWGLAATEIFLPIVLDANDQAGPWEAIAEAAALVACDGPLVARPPMFEAVATDAGPRLVYALGACCRAYRWVAQDHGYCSVCPIVPAAERLERQLSPAHE